MLIQIKILVNHYHGWLIKLTLSKIVISVIPNVEHIFQTMKILDKNTLFHIATRLNAEM